MDGPGCGRTMVVGWERGPVTLVLSDWRSWCSSCGSRAGRLRRWGSSAQTRRRPQTECWGLKGIAAASRVDADCREDPDSRKVGVPSRGDALSRAACFHPTIESRTTAAKPL